MDMTNGKLSCYFEGIQEHVLYENIPTEKSLFPIIIGTLPESNPIDCSLMIQPFNGLE